jgi:hypothetical protein
LRRALVVALLGLAAVLAGPVPARAQPEAERLRTAKALFFDGKYSEARQAWQGLVSAAGADGDAARYWVARCSEKLGEDERAFREFGAYLDRRPADRALAEEARTSRVALAARLYKAGRTEHLALLKGALADPSRTVRYYAAFQLAGLGPKTGQPAVPVLKGILADETDEDLVERAKLALMKVDPRALSQVPPAALHEAAPKQRAHWIKLRIFERGNSKPEVSLSLPVALAEMVFKSLPDEARDELRKKGYNPDNFWERLRGLGTAEILKIEGEDGELIEIWLE